MVLTVFGESRGPPPLRLASRNVSRSFEEGELREHTDAGGLARFIGAILQAMTVQAQDGAGKAELLPIGEFAVAEVARHCRAAA
ncbi:hypothetical protein [Ensifer oleiphilus]|uniref:hypothetical protein n=1 Tax=Ensifer oleiphilus TaxID=2742698 RepID=UPI001FEE43C2|nr:hypothetical protein [Ensifer oleiphilus]